MSNKKPFIDKQSKILSLYQLVITLTTVVFFVWTVFTLLTDIHSPLLPYAAGGFITCWALLLITSIPMVYKFSDQQESDVPH